MNQRRFSKDERTQQLHLQCLESMQRQSQDVLSSLIMWVLTTRSADCNDNGIILFVLSGAAPQRAAAASSDLVVWENPLSTKDDVRISSLPINGHTREKYLTNSDMIRNPPIKTLNMTFTLLAVSGLWIQFYFPKSRVLHALMQKNSTARRDSRINMMSPLTLAFKTESSRICHSYSYFDGFSHHLSPR